MSKKYKEILIDTFKVGDILHFDLFTYINENFVLLLSNGKTLVESDIDKINKFKHVFILSINIPIYEELKEKKFKDKSQIIYNNAVNALTSILDNPDKPNNLEKTSEIVDYLTNFVLSDNFTIKSLFEIMSHDYYTHTHSINVSIYTLSFAVFLGLPLEDIKKIGISALLHDLGKSKIDFNIINKQGKLDDSEFIQMKKHPEIGDFLARNIGISDKDILSGIKDHHEKLDGSGYPCKLKGHEISLFAKIIGICDIFDALSTRRSYKEPMTSFEALLLMKKTETSQTDQELLTKFILMFQKK